MSMKKTNVKPENLKKAETLTEEIINGWEATAEDESTPSDMADKITALFKEVNALPIRRRLPTFAKLAAHAAAIYMRESHNATVDQLLERGYTEEAAGKDADNREVGDEVYNALRYSSVQALATAINRKTSQDGVIFSAREISQAEQFMLNLGMPLDMLNEGPKMTLVDGGADDSDPSDGAAGGDTKVM